LLTTTPFRPFKRKYSSHLSGNLAKSSNLVIVITTKKAKKYCMFGF
jgi:hypothetical protein